MAKLNQIIAIEKGIKSRTYSEFTNLNKMAQKPELFNGFAKTYQPKDEDSETFPPENKRIQITASVALGKMNKMLSEVMNITARKDYSNCEALADVKIDEKVIIPNAPVSYLLFLEKQINDVRTFVSNLPVLDSTEEWDIDENSGLYKTEQTQTHRTKKTVRPIVMYDATPEHPAQTQLINEDVIVGYWNQVKHSGGLPSPKKEEIIARVEKLSEAIKQAREAANGIDEIPAPDAGAAIFNYILGE